MLTAIRCGSHNSIVSWAYSSMACHTVIPGRPTLGAQLPAAPRCAAHGRRRSVVRCAADSSAASDAAAAPTSRRAVLAAIWAAPVLCEAALGSLRAAHASGGPRMLTTAEAAAVQQAFASVLPKARAPVVLRLAFHDAGTYDSAAGNGGANASILFELDRPESIRLGRGWRVIEDAAEKLKGTAAEGAVSLADLVALAGAYAVRITGGPEILVPIGRVDAVAADPEDRMPPETLTASEQLAMFASKGITAQEMVALLGSHTLGGKGFGDPVTFDNAYYSSLLKKPWENKGDSMAAMIGLPSDHVLPDDPTCRPIIERYAADQSAFHADFAQAYVKLTSLGAQWA